MSAAAKFMFDTDFGGNSEGKPAEPVITLAEHAVKLAAAETAAHRRGYADAQNDAKAEADRRIAAALEHIAAGLAVANDALHAIETRLECEAVDVAVAVARKLAPALVAREPFAEISALASGCFKELMTSPHIAVRVNDALYAAAKEKLDDIVRVNGFEGRLVVLAEPGLTVGDCRIEWADGGVNRDSAVTEAVITDAVTGYIAARRGLAPVVASRETGDMPRAAAQELLRRYENE